MTLKLREWPPVTQLDLTSPVNNMSYKCCSENFSSRSPRGPPGLPRPPVAPPVAPPSSATWSTGLTSVVPGSAAHPCGAEALSDVLLLPKDLHACSPFQHFSGSPGCGSIRGCSLGYGSRSCYSLGLGIQSGLWIQSLQTAGLWNSWLPFPEVWIQVLPPSLLGF